MSNTEVTSEYMFPNLLDVVLGYMYDEQDLTQTTAEDRQANRDLAGAVLSDLIPVTFPTLTEEWLKENPTEHKPAGKVFMCNYWQQAFNQTPIIGSVRVPLYATKCLADVVLILEEKRNGRHV